MAQSNEGLFQAIKNDDIKAFKALMENAQCGAFRLGRFPVLSLLYLYNSRRIISTYEQKFLKITSYELLGEPVEVSKKFSEKAGKCLRLYLDEIVSPLEMLLILDKTKRIKRVYPDTKPSSAIKERLKLIYSIKYSLNVKFEGSEIILDRRPLSYREKKNIATVCMCSALAVAVAVGVPVLTVTLIPKPVEGEVTKFEQIDFGSTDEYTFKRDIVLPENYSVEKLSCKINGNGNKLILSGKTSLGALSGSISNLTIESAGQTLFTSVSENATIQNVTINAEVSYSSTAGTALVAVTNYGTIDGVTLNVSGQINAQASSEASDDFTFAGVVLNNSYKYNTSTQKPYMGTVKNCTVNYSHLELCGEAMANGTFGGIVGNNSGYLQDCTVTGEIVGDTFDIAGVCVYNSGLLSGNLNEADIYQSSADTDWNPIACGIVLSNDYAVENCENRGAITAASTCGQFETEAGEPTVSAAGIAYINGATSANAYIFKCVNYGNIESSAEYRSAYAAGVCMSSSGEIAKCKNSGSVTMTAGNGCGTFGGGITSIAYGNIYTSVNEGAIIANGSGTAYVGGISAHSSALFSYCMSGGDITVTAQNICVGGILGFSEVNWYGYGTVEYCISESKLSVTEIDGTPAYVGGIVGCVREGRLISGMYVGGGVTNSYFAGECVSEVTYFGNIVGVCGANIYEANLQYNSHNFDGNYFIENSYNALGTTVDNGSFVPAEDSNKGATRANNLQDAEGYKAILDAIENN